MKAIVPKKRFSPDSAWDTVIERFEQTVVDFADRKFGETHASWSAENQPDEVIEKTETGRGVTWFVGRDGLIYCYVSRGTGPRTLTSDTSMFFGATYSASTQRGSTRSGSHSQSGARVGPVWSVEHETEDRLFDETVLDLVQRYLPTRINTLKEALKKGMWV